MINKTIKYNIYKKYIRENLLSGTRGFIVDGYIDKKVITPAIYNMGLILSKVNLVEEANNSDRYCTEYQEKNFTINHGYIRLKEQGNPFKEFTNPDYQDGVPYLNSYILMNNKYSNDLRQTIQKFSYVLSSNIKNPIDVVYNVMREYLNIPITNFDFDYATTKGTEGKLRTFQFTNDVITGYTDIDVTCNNFDDLHTILLKDVYNDDTSLINNYDFVISKTVGDNKLSVILAEMSNLGRFSIHTTYANKLAIKPLNIHSEKPSYIINDFDDILVNKNDFSYSTGYTNNIPSKLNITLKSAFTNFSDTSFVIELPELIEQHESDLQYSSKTLTFNNTSKNIKLPIAIDLPLFLKFGTYTEYKKFIENVYTNDYDLFTQSDLAFKLSMNYQIYVLKIVQEYFYNMIKLERLTFTTTINTTIFELLDVIQFDDDKYDYLKGNWKIIKIVEKDKGLVEYTMKKIKDDIHLKPSLEFMQKNKFPVYFGKNKNIIW